jgi:inhibitor of cysteine peptidase
MASDKFILMGLDDERSADVAEVLRNNTCKKILDYMAEEKEVSEKDIADAMKMPINTVEYNLKKLVKSGLVEKTKNFFWSVKGKKIPMYKLARKHIIISPNKKFDMSYLKSILPIFAAIAFMAVLLGLIFFVPMNNEITKDDVTKVTPADLKAFASYNELKDFLKQNSKSGESFNYYTFAERDMARGAVAMETVTTSGSSNDASKSSSPPVALEHSDTNLQVEGVDEPDIVKNDGRYVYVASGSKISIVDAYPAKDMKILSEINFSNGVSNIFINGDKLIAFSSEYSYAKRSAVACLGCGGGSYQQKTIVKIYDISDRENPRLDKEIETDGNYVDSRMIGDYVYIISNKNADYNNPEPPIYIMDGIETKTRSESVYYWNYPDSSYVFTSVMAVDLINEDFESKVYLTGYSGTVYVSEKNIYLTYQKTISYEDRFNQMIEDVYMKILPDNLKEKVKQIIGSSDAVYTKMDQIQQMTADYSNSLNGNVKADFDEKLMSKLEEFNVNIERESQKTVMHKINVDKKDINYIGVGEVPGIILNQFSMDESDGKFRIATTTGQWGENSVNNVYVLDENLKVIGKLEGLAEGEKIFSARFMGNRCYLVTFEGIDPLFVIDLEDSANPKILGYLKIPGYSDYLHPYDETHLIGIGKDVDAKIDADKVHSTNAVYYTAIKGVKVSLFDVSDVEHPIEVDKYIIGDRGTSSPISLDHKAFLFDKEKNLLVVPVQVAQLRPSSWDPKYEDSVMVWQGAMVFDINKDGIGLRGKITHDKNIGKENYYPDYGYQIKRSLYMDNTLYTISDAMIKANDLETINEINSVELRYKNDYYPIPRLYATGAEGVAAAIE